MGIFKDMKQMKDAVAGAPGLMQQAQDLQVAAQQQMAAQQQAAAAGGGPAAVGGTAGSDPSQVLVAGNRGV